MQRGFLKAVACVWIRSIISTEFPDDLTCGTGSLMSAIFSGLKSLEKILLCSTFDRFFFAFIIQKY